VNQSQTADKSCWSQM